MYKVQRITSGSLVSKGVTFKPEVWVEVSEETYKYLKETYPNNFEFKKDKPKKTTKRVVNKTSKSTKKDVDSAKDS